MGKLSPAGGQSPNEGLPCSWHPESSPLYLLLHRPSPPCLPLLFSPLQLSPSLSYPAFASFALATLPQPISVSPRTGTLSKDLFRLSPGLCLLPRSAPRSRLLFQTPPRAHTEKQGPSSSHTRAGRFSQTQVQTYAHDIQAHACTPIPTPIDVRELLPTGTWAHRQLQEESELWLAKAYTFQSTFTFKVRGSAHTPSLIPSSLSPLSPAQGSIRPQDFAS